jgi:large conductance mechanosensitive channel
MISIFDSWRISESQDTRSGRIEEKQQTGPVMFEEFKKFAMRGNVVDLSVGVVVGSAFTSIVNSLVKDIIAPPLGWITGGIDFSNFFLVLKGGHYATLAEAQKAGAITINYGLFINAIISFLIVAFSLFLVLHQLNKLFVPKPAPSEPASPPEDVVLLREIRDLLKQRA